MTITSNDLRQSHRTICDNHIERFFLKIITPKHVKIVASQK